MALQSSGTIKMSEINTELGRSSTATISLDAAESGGIVPLNPGSPSTPNDARPAAMSEWYGYDHTASSSPDGRLNETPKEDPGQACPLQFALDLYKDGASSVPDFGQQLFTDSARTIPYSTPTPGQWYKYYDLIGGRGYALYLLADGIIEGIVEC